MEAGGVRRVVSRRNAGGPACPAPPRVGAFRQVAIRPADDGAVVLHLRRASVPIGTHARGSPVGAGADAVGPGEVAGEVALVREAAVEGLLGDGAPRGEEAPSLLYLPLDAVGVGRQTRRGAEEAGEMPSADAGHGREGGERHGLLGGVVDPTGGARDAGMGRGLAVMLGRRDECRDDAEERVLSGKVCRGVGGRGDEAGVEAAEGLGEAPVVGDASST